MADRSGAVTMKGNPLTLEGSTLKVGQPAPNFKLAANDLSPLTLDSLKGKKLVISCVPSLDTPVCDLETRRFNKEAEKLSSDTVILTVSMDLPFAQKRWCGLANATRVQTASDYRDASFAKAYGVLIKELHLLARAIFVVDRKGIVQYIQLVKEVTSEPDYNAALDSLKKIS